VTTGLVHRPNRAISGDGGLPARRAMVRWAWRLFRREWRQQLLVLLLIVVAVAATVVGAAVSTNTPPAPNAGFGSAQDLATFPGTAPHLLAQIDGLARRFGPLDVIENQTVAIPGSLQTYQLRAQNPHGRFGRPMLSLVAGHYPTGAGQVGVTTGLAATFGLRIGDTWRQGGVTRRVVGIVENPQSLLDEFALVAPGQVRHPTQVTLLFDAPGVRPAAIAPNVEIRSSATPHNQINPETIVLALVTLLMLLVGLVAVGGFTVLAQRRLRSLAILEALGATDSNIRLVVRANGAVVGLVGAVLGFVVGLGGWLAYRPELETSAHHLIGAFQLPWLVIGTAMALAVVAAFLAASRPARAMSRLPVVTALSGRPADARQVRRSAVPGVVVAVIAFFLLGSAAANSHGGGSGELVLGLVALVAAVILLAPTFLALLVRLTGEAPLPIRLAVRDLARYRARSSSALAAISLGVLIAVLICVIAAARYANVLDYVGPNLASNQVIVQQAPARPVSGAGSGPTPRGAAPVTGRATRQKLGAQVRAIAAELGAPDAVELETTGATLQHAGSGRQFSGTLYVATPELLAAFGIGGSRINPSADILTMRQGFSGISRMQLVYGNYYGPNGPFAGGHLGAFPCPKTDCLPDPRVEEVNSLPGGTSAPNTVITERAVRELHLHPTPAGWFVQTPHTLAAAQITSARLAAAAAGLAITTKSDQPTSSEILNWATLFGLLLALGVLAISVGLIRSETAQDLRALTATGAGSWTRRNLAAATGGALALLGAVLGMVAAYIAAFAYFLNSSLNGGVSDLGNVPVGNLLVLLVGMPLIAAVLGWLLAGREPPAVARRPLE
jgi:putative ABC transport system permease protein